MLVMLVMLVMLLMLQQPNEIFIVSGEQSGNTLTVSQITKHSILMLRAGKISKLFKSLLVN